MLICCVHESIVQVFGCRHDEPSTPCGGRRPKSAKARSRGSLALAVLRALWGFDGGAGLEVDVTPTGCGRRISPLARLEAYSRHLSERLKRIKERTARRPR